MRQTLISGFSTFLAVFMGLTFIITNQLGIRGLLTSVVAITGCSGVMAVLGALFYYVVVNSRK